jgi:hypothetical protein
MSHMPSFTFLFTILSFGFWRKLNLLHRHPFYALSHCTVRYVSSDIIFQRQDSSSCDDLKMKRDELPTQRMRKVENEEETVSFNSGLGTDSESGSKIRQTLFTLS